jgi:hypothetical protein
MRGKVFEGDIFLLLLTSLFCLVVYLQDMCRGQQWQALCGRTGARIRLLQAGVAASPPFLDIEW